MPPTDSAEEATFNYAGSNPAQVTDTPSVDMFSDHYYPAYAAPITNDANAVAGAGKVFFVGEYDWHAGESVTGCSTYGTCGGDPLATILSTIEGNSNVSGDLFWELWNPGVAYTYYFYLDYPGDNADMQTRIQQFAAHGAKMQQ
jgi:hypothetical protein